MAEIETWAIVAFTAVLTIIEVNRVVEANRERQLDRVQRKIELAFTISAWSWTDMITGGKDLVLRAAKAFQELTAVIDFPGDNVVEVDIRNVLNGLMDVLRSTQGVDRLKDFERVQERIRWGIMGWVEESERLKRPWWET